MVSGGRQLPDDRSAATRLALKLERVTDWNDKIVAEFRANDGRVGGNFEDAPMLILHSTGAKSGQERVSPMMYLATASGWAVFASNAGQSANSAWYHNLRANPLATIEVGTETVEVAARELVAEERTPVWEEQKRRYPGFADYEQQTTRTIPVMLLSRRRAPAEASAGAPGPGASDSLGSPDHDRSGSTVEEAGSQVEGVHTVAGRQVPGETGSP